MPYIRLIHWNAAEAEERAARIRAAGYDVAFDALKGSIRELAQNPPAAIVIDLSRLPGQGRDVALALRHRKATRHLPLVFVDGEPEKVAGIKTHLPDAVFTTWSRIGASLKRVIARPPVVTTIPHSVLAGYSGTPLPKKLGIKANSVVALVDAPQGFEKALGELPEGVTLNRQASGRPNLVIWFTKSRKDFERRIERMVPLAEHGSLWIAWPKKTSQIPADLTQQLVRETAMAAGLVDFKICAIDATWSGLRFSRRKSG